MAKDKLNVIAFANSLAIVSAIVYVVCGILIAVSIKFSTTLGNLIFHGIELAGIVVPRNFGFFIGSLIIGSALAWVLGWLFAKTYNKIA